MPVSTNPTQLLQAWNPLTEPLTVKVHVDALLRCKGDRRVWFGRIYAGRAPEALTPEGARSKWPHVARVAEGMEQTGRELLLLATNFQSLHALRVDRVAFGADGARDDAGHIPAYYRDRKVAIWFRVRDIRPLSHEQMATLSWLEDNARVEPEDQSGSFEFGFDPYRSFHFRYPVAVRSLPVDEVFDYARMAPSSGQRELFAAQPGTVFPPNLDVARETLRAEMDPPWSLLEEPSRHYLASSTLVESLQQHGDKARYGMEPSAALMLLSKAVETECRAVLELLRGVTRGAPRWKTTGHLSTLTLGDVGPLFRDLLPSLPTPRLPVTANLLRSAEWIDWLGEFGRARNRAAHAEPLPPSEFRRHRDLILVKNRSRLAPLCHAKKEMLNAVAS
jgi:hypothetical protein